jgi:hypothetical protein
MEGVSMLILRSAQVFDKARLTLPAGLRHA